MSRLEKQLMQVAAISLATLATSIATARADSLMLTVDPFSGIVSIQNPSTSTALSLDGYQITSASGALLLDPTHTMGVGWDSFADAGLAGWEEVSPTANALSELNLSASISIPAASSVSLGHAFSSTGAQDLQWGYSAPGSNATNPATILFAGGLQLQVINLLGNHGSPVEETMAVLWNQESSQSFDVDVYTIQSASGSLKPAGFSGFASHGVAGWELVAPSTNALSELNLSSSTALAPGAAQVLGSAFTTGAMQDLQLQFHVVGPSTQPLNGTVIYRNQLAGDVNNDAVVNIFDINLISSNWATTGLAGDGNYDGAVDIFDVNYVSSHWGNTLGGGVATVPEPSSFVLLAVGLLTSCGHAYRRRREVIQATLIRRTM
jgi:PEP-CTERM motif